ncbi:MAG: hypothetical protein QW666_00180 [Candidatus Woesearchaeota archaeon]
MQERISNLEQENRELREKIESANETAEALKEFEEVMQGIREEFEIRFPELHDVPDDEFLTPAFEKLDELQDQRESLLDYFREKFPELDGKPYSKINEAITKKIDDLLKRSTPESQQYEQELEVVKRKLEETKQHPSRHITAEEHKNMISEKEKQLNEKCAEIAELQAAIAELRSAEANYLIEKSALSKKLAETEAELKSANRFLNMAQDALDAANRERDAARKELTTLSGLEKLRKYHKSFMEQLKTQPILVGLLLKAAVGMGKTRQDMSDPSKTLDLTENMDWLLLHIVDVLPRAYDWTDIEVKLVGEANAKLVEANARVYDSNVHMPKSEHDRIVAEVKSLLEKDLAAAKANAYNPGKHVMKDAHMKALAAAKKVYTAETDALKAKIKGLEAQLADSKKNTSELLLSAAERMADLLRENREMYVKLNQKL